LIPVATVEVSGPATGKVGDKVTFTAVAKAADGSALTGRPITWGVSDGALASITQEGVVTILAPGEVTITADCQGVGGSAVLTGTSG
jgi:uncharacterized protein YjdB